ncbi:MAG: hypothetical protein WC565_08415 [Parcubacteria group bacterium]
MPVSDKTREAVRQAAHDWCEFFHDVPVEGSLVAHYAHQGMGGAPDDSAYNDPENLLWSCPACHDLVDGRSEHAPWKIVRFSRKDRELEIVDAERRKIDHSRIFFHNRDVWLDAGERYPQLADAVRRRNEAALDVAKLLAYFRPSKKGPQLFRVCPEVKQMDKADFWTFVSLLGMTSSAAKELIPVGKWANEIGMEDSMRGIDIDALDALRGAEEDELPDLMELARAKPAAFWAEVDKRTRERHGRRAHYLQVTPDGFVKDLGLHTADPDTEEAFALIKGTVTKPNARVLRDEAGA